MCFFTDGGDSVRESQNIYIASIKKLCFPIDIYIRGIYNYFGRMRNFRKKYE